MDVEQRRVGPDRGPPAEGAAGHQPAPDPGVVVEGRQIVQPVMREAGLTLLVGLRQGYPGLDAVRRAALAARPLDALAVGDALARGHPVDLARPDRLLRADAVALNYVAVEPTP